MSRKKDWPGRRNPGGVPAMPQKTINSAPILHQQQKMTVFQGVLPPPDMLKEYSAIIPDAPERLLRLVERESESRHDVMRKMVADNHREVTAGIIATSVISLSIIGFGAYCVYKGYPYLGLTSVAVNVAAIVCAYLKQSKSRGGQTKE